MRILILLHDAFGGRGGIAKFNRDLLFSITSYPEVSELVVLPRIIVDPIGPLPKKLDYRTKAAGGKAAFLIQELKLLTDRRPFDLIICGHLRLIPLIHLLRLRFTSQIGLILHGVDAWDPFGGPLTRAGLRKLDWFLSVSDYTKKRFIAWSGVTAPGLVVPNAVDLTSFTPGPKRADLLARYGLTGKRVLMGMGRLDTRERYKGFDEVIEALPILAKRYPDIAYLICGEGNDLARLATKAKEVGVAERVVFSGYVSETEKVDTYRLADCFLLAGWGEGFGIVLLEAMACGVPVIASSLDASAEAVDNGRFGTIVDPHNQAELIAGIDAALSHQGVVPNGLETFSDAAFERRIHRLILDPLRANVKTN